MTTNLTRYQEVEAKIYAGASLNCKIRVRGPTDTNRRIEPNISRNVKDPQLCRLTEVTLGSVCVKELLRITPPFYYTDEFELGLDNGQPAIISIRRLPETSIVTNSTPAHKYWMQVDWFIQFKKGLIPVV